MKKYTTALVVLATILVAAPFALAQAGIYNTTTVTSISNTVSNTAVVNSNIPSNMPTISSNVLSNTTANTPSNVIPTLSSTTSNMPANIFSLTNQSSNTFNTAVATSTVATVGLVNTTNQTTPGLIKSNIFTPGAGGSIAWQGSGYYEIPTGAQNIPATGMTPGVAYWVTNQAFISNVNVLLL
jgi:hypothetical protein